MSLTAEQVRERLATIIFEETGNAHLVEAAADAIMREFALRPVAQGVVDSETGEAEFMQGLYDPAVSAKELRGRIRRED